MDEKKKIPPLVEETHISPITDREIQAKLNVQRNSFQLTINNPLEDGFDHTTIKETLVSHFPTLVYFCMADEVAETGTPHTHLYIVFRSRVRWSTVKKHFPTAHIEVARGTVTNNIEYIQKSGKWKDSEKAETSVPGTFEEWGSPPKQKGKNVAMEELYNLVFDGYNNAEILAINHDYILHIDKIDRLRTTILAERYRGKRRLNLKVIYIFGETGTGKTRYVLDTHGDRNVYKVCDYQHPFDTYSYQSVMCFEEYRSQLPIADMLQYLDIYPIDLPARYSNRFMCAQTIYMLSNEPLEDQYRNIQLEKPESWNAFLRRISEVWIFEKDKIKVYDSVQKYLERSEDFHTLSIEESRVNPFNK